MRFFALLPLLLVCAATAAAAAKPALTDRNSSARLVGCDTETRTAMFAGEMKAFGKATGLSMRFDLEIRGEDELRWERVKGVAKFGTWETADAGVKQFILDKTIEGLVPGLRYRAAVRFRWRTAKGRIAARAVRRTRPCRQPDTRPNLQVLRITASEGSAETTQEYAVRIVNTGQTDAPVFATSLDVPGTTVADQLTGEPLAPGEEDVLFFEAPRCSPGTSLTATADTDAQVDESDELDNVLAVACPTRRR